jgi:hypothetical protein
MAGLRKTPGNFIDRTMVLDQSCPGHPFLQSDQANLPPSDRIATGKVDPLLPSAEIGEMGVRVSA